MKKFSLIFSALLSTLQLFSQTPGWHTLTNAHSVQSRHEDIFFLNAYTGWTFYSYLNKVSTYKTTDGGYTWDSLITPMPGYVFFRCIGFFNSQTGIAGTLTLNKPLYRTTDGGISWILISNPPSVSNGICGISIVDSTTAYAVGIYSGPAGIIKTTDAGLNWDSVSTDTSLVRLLVDCYFWSQDSGIAVGGYRGYASVIITTNGGTSWQRAHLSNRIGEWCWKISFVSRMVGFVSIERSGFSYILKTTNGGFNWIEIPFMVYDQEGIGFLNEQTGWVGGWTGPTYETTNGGANWHQVPWGYYINRFRFINDTTAYAVGRTVYKFTTEPIGIQPVSNEVPKMFFLHQNYPNPFNPKTKIKFDIKSTSLVRLIIYDAIGRKADELINENLKPGIYETGWDASGYSSGIYFYELRAGEFRNSKKMVLIK